MCRETGDPSKARNYFPLNKQYLVTRNVPCLSRASDIEKYDSRSEFALGGDEEGWVATHQDPRTQSTSAAAGTAADDIPDLDAAEPAAAGARGSHQRDVPSNNDDELPDISELELQEPDDEVSMHNSDHMFAFPSCWLCLCMQGQTLMAGSNNSRQQRVATLLWPMLSPSNCRCASTASSHLYRMNLSNRAWQAILHQHCYSHSAWHPAYNNARRPSNNLLLSLCTALVLFYCCAPCSLCKSSPAQCGFACRLHFQLLMVQLAVQQ
eukprot:GHRR01034544.1.p1 GENE.GHRR01034544.1~~GHRR01034544.1.p1  ORF type:complete len:266 (+),score=46.70 GHRR01034544.1:434-1231(+)